MLAELHALIGSCVVVQASARDCRVFQESAGMLDRSIDLQVDGAWPIGEPARGLFHLAVGEESNASFTIRERELSRASTWLADDDLLSARRTVAIEFGGGGVLVVREDYLAELVELDQRGELPGHD